MSSPVLRLRGGAGKVARMNNVTALNELIATYAGKLIVIDFTASWCGPCQRIAPIYVQMSEKYTDVVFVKVDVDDAGDLTEQYGVTCIPTCMPTFVFLKNGARLHTIEGADVASITTTIEANM